MITVEIKGLNNIIKNFGKNYPKRLQSNLKDAVKKSIYQLEHDIKPKVPVDTARLRASIGGGVFKGGSFKQGYGIEFKDYQGTIGTNVEYAKHVHYGTKYMQARPFMTQGLAVSKSKIKKFFQDAVKNIEK